MNAMDRMKKDQEDNLIPSADDVAERLYEELGDEMPLVMNRGTVFFKPDMKFVQWLIKYAAGRLIVEVGCGTAHLLRMIKSQGYHRVMGIEPSWDPLGDIDRGKDWENPLHVMPWDVKKASKMLFDITKINNEELDPDKAFQGSMIVIARPNHTGWPAEVLEAIAPNTELLYITKPSVLDDYEDFGEYQDLLRIISDVEGGGQQDEMVWRVIRPEEL